jgi:hypothetical protein
MLVLGRALLAGSVVAVLGALVLLKIAFFGGLLLAIGYGFLVGEAVRRGARRRVHTRFGVTAVASVLIGIGSIATAFSIPLLAGPVLFLLLIGGAVAFVRASGVW